MADSRFKQLCFNELTLHPLCSNTEEVYKRIETYVKTLKEALQRLNIKHVRYSDDSHNIPISDTISLNDFCSKNKHKLGISIILSSYTMPQVDPNNESATSNFENTSVSVTIAGKQKPSLGLAAAYVYGVPSIGFNSEKCWNDVIHTISVTSNNNTENEDWPCLTRPEHLTQNEFQQWLQEHAEIALVETQLTPEKKQIKLRDDHGKDVLFKHARILCNNKYVEGVLGSLSYRPSRSYIRNIAPNGVVDIVLFWEDKGYSMRIKTTGRNLRETSKIAEILKEKYSK